MILCHWNGQWFLSTGINQEKGICWLRCGKQMPRPHYFQPLPPIGAQWYGNTDDVAGITFYPNIYYHGLKVWPLSWMPETNEPVLRCEAMPEQGDLDSEYFQEAVRRTGARSGEELLVADGWSHPDKFTYQKALHIDELEKFEGPPPEGPF